MGDVHQKNQGKRYPIDGVLFLDIDGVVCTARAQHAMKVSGTWNAFDPLAIQMIKNLCDDYQLRIVISSTWRIGGNDTFNIKLILGTHGIDPKYFWKDWATPWVNTQHSDRGLQIKQWLAKHPNVTRFIIVDDNLYDFVDQKLDKRLIQTDPDDGFTAKNYITARNKLCGMT